MHNCGAEIETIKYSFFLRYQCFASERQNLPDDLYLKDPSFIRVDEYTSLYSLLYLI